MGGQRFFPVLVVTSLGCGRHPAMTRPVDGSLPADSDAPSVDAASPTDAAFSCTTPGSLDLSFGVGGFAPVAFGSISEASAVVFDRATGRLLVGGSLPADRRRCFVFALRDDGTLDTTYGTSGVTQVALDGYNCDVDDLALQSTGKLVITGEAYAEPIGGHPMLARLTADGTLDSSFGTDGAVVAEPDVLGQVAGVAIDADDRIVTAVEVSDDFNSTTTHFATARYTPDGALDPTFADGGVALDAFHNGQDGAFDVALQDDGKIVVAGMAASTAMSHVGIARYQPDGSLDPTFGSGGTVIGPFNIGALGTAIAVDPTGHSVVIGGSASGDGGAVARFATDGMLDPEFADHGQLVTHVNPNGLSFQHVAIGADGAILVAGIWSDGTAGNELLLARLDKTGAPDPTFGTGGFAPVSPPGANRNVAWSLVEQPDGKVVVVGARGVWPSTLDVAVARFCP